MTDETPPPTAPGTTAKTIPYLDTTPAPWFDGTTRDTLSGAPFVCTDGHLHYVLPGGWARSLGGVLVPWKDSECAVRTLLQDAPPPPTPWPTDWTWAVVVWDDQPGRHVTQIMAAASGKHLRREADAGPAIPVDDDGSMTVVRLLPDLEL